MIVEEVIVIVSLANILETKPTMIEGNHSTTDELVSLPLVAREGPDLSQCRNRHP